MRSAEGARLAAERRCAVYTRKSTEEGLDQAFNSLDAQREACAAYILSQAGEGWVASPELYDDGGISGGTMERPALKRLLADVQAGKVNVIVVYKVDRLTRSLADFAKIVEILDAAGASFVSVTQAFNTTNSMGRLTLNVLLSFAQFEREVIGERVRDKVAASKRKGIWMGGPVPLGYDVCDRKLVPNEAEAETVRHIFRRYLGAGSVRELIGQLTTDGVRTKVRQTTAGPRGGIAIQRGALFHLLKNRIYRGEIVHKGTAYPGEHPAIVPKPLWDEVQAKLESSGPGKLGERSRRAEAMLVGILYDGHGRRMTPSQTNKGAKRYRYYVTMPAELDPAGAPDWRVPAHDLERIIVQRLLSFLGNTNAVIDAMGASDPNNIEQLAAEARRLASLLDTTGDLVRIARSLLSQVALSESSITLTVQPGAIDSNSNAPNLTLTAPVARVRMYKESRLIVLSPASRAAATPDRDERLVQLIAEAFAARELLLASPGATIKDIAFRQSICRKRYAQLVRISWLPPDIIRAALGGNGPATFTAAALIKSDLPANWAAQRDALHRQS